MTQIEIKHHRIRSTDGLTLAVVEGGERSGPPILFVHGYLFSAAAFARQFEGALTRHHRLIAMDLRGHGDSEKPRDLAAYANPAMWADDVACVLDALEVEQAIIVGWSLGSRVTLNYAWHHGFARIAALNLVAATLARNSHGSSAGLPPQFRELLAPEPELRRTATRRFVDACGFPGGEDSQPLHTFAEAAMGVPVEARLGSRAWPILYDDALSWISAPTLITHGALDPLVMERTARAHVEVIPEAELALIADAGHLVFFQSPARFNDDLATLARRVFPS